MEIFRISKISYLGEYLLNRKHFLNISSFEGTSYENLWNTLTRSFISCCFYWILHQQISFLTNFSELHLTLSEKKIFVTNFSFLMDPLKHPSPHPVNGQNPLSMTKIFWCSLSSFYQSVRNGESHRIFIAAFYNTVTAFPTFYYRGCSFCFLPIFSTTLKCSLQRYKRFQ